MPTRRQNFAPKKLTISFVLFCFLLTQVLGGIFLYAKPVNAQLVVTDPITGAQTTVKNVKDFLKIVIVNGGIMAMINAASNFTQKIAYDLAVSLASGGGGEMPLFSTEGWGDYFENVALDAAGEFIGSFGDMFGVNLCAPPNPQVGLSIQLGLVDAFGGEGPTPRCEWSQIQSNWESFISEVQTEEFLKNTASQFQVGYGAGNDFDLAVTGFIGAFGVQKSATEEAKLTREEGQGFLPLTELISGRVKTPAEIIRQTSELTTQGPVEAENVKTGLSGQALSAGAEGILMQFVSTFLNTLLSKTMNKLFSKGFYSLADLFPSGGNVRDEEGTAWGGRKAAELAFADFLTPQIKEGGAVDILAQFVVCPEKFRGQNNCVLDGQFEAAVRRAQTGEPLTVSQAIKQNLLHANWPLIPPTNEADNQDPYCYSKAYCYSNLAKMRKARIIPIGWEIAALSSTSSSPVRLGEVVSKFYDCNAEGKADSEHKYCHLIDPNWILKAPPQQCRAKVYGPVLQTAENNFRQEVCVDSPTCIAEDDNGNCEGGWANCLREKNIWRLNGDKCEAQYDTCRALKRRDGQQASYLINTIDNGPPCTSEDIGCRWYSTEQSKVGDAWQWQDRLSDEGSGTTRSDRIFFNKNVAQCDESGCNEFLRTTKGTKANLISNSSFEDFVGTINDGVSDTFTGWLTSTVRPGMELPNTPPEAVSDTYFGRTALKIPATGTNILKFVETGKPVAGKTFVLSLFVKNVSETEPCAARSLAASAALFFGSIDRERPEGGAPEGMIDYWRRASFSSSLPALGDVPTAADGGFPNWQRLQFSYNFPNSSPYTTNTVVSFRFSGMGGVGGGGNCLIDAIQLEEGSMTNYHEGWGKTGEAVYLKSASDYYACYDYNSDGSLNKTNDADSCKDFSKACEEKDVGCEKFTPANGDPWIPGVASYPDDYCPQECVGYQTFKQVSADFEQEKFPVYFIPSTARACTAADAGCDQFTSLETEAVANFSSIRRCEKPSATTSATFYTWEGSDTSGYQLKNWNLKVSEETAVIIDRSPTGGRGPCTKLDPTDSTQCADDGLTGTCTKADLAANPDCREFYDSLGNKHYRLYSKTIIATDDCHPYRKTISNSIDCGNSGGKWDLTKNECTYQVYLPETRICSDAAVGCRAYRGNAGANVAVIFENNFDDSATAGWSSGTVSSESLTVGGKSLSVARDATASKDAGSSVRKGGIYTLSFWAKGDSKLDIKFTHALDGKAFSEAVDLTAAPTAELSFDWRYFALGPVYITWDPALDEKLQITPRGGTMASAYIDNITLREVQDYIYLAKNSWQTPVSCDRTFLIDFTATDSAGCSVRGGAWSTQTGECIVSGALPQAQLGCELYRDRANRDHYLKSFSRLCSPDAAGCEKLIKTGNNTATAAEEFNKENDSDPSLSAEERLSDNVKIPADQFAFLIVDDAYKCKAQNKGCADFGSPTLDASGNVKVGDDGKPRYDAVSLLADPAKYSGDTGKILCQVQYQGCEEYSTTEGGTLYFKDPGARTCEWKENITVLGRSVTGWFKKGTDPAEPCDPLAFYGGTYNIWKNGDIRCTLPNVCNDTCTRAVCTADAGCTCSGSGGRACTVKKDATSCRLDCPCSVDTTPGATGIAGSSCTVAFGKRTCPYSGWVGECPATANMCTKYVDPADTKTSEEGEPYYYIKNDKLTPGNCNGMVSQRDGCVLLNDTSVTQLNYNANATYASSEHKVGDPGGTVTPVDCRSAPDNPNCKRCLRHLRVRPVINPPPDYTYYTSVYCDQALDCRPSSLPGSEEWFCVNPSEVPLTDAEKSDPAKYGENTGQLPGRGRSPNDTNTLLKVRRDRVCGEWLDCTSTNSTFDSQTGRQKTLCEELGVCNSYNKTGEATKCIDWVDEPDTYRKILTKDLYTSRDTTWSGMEYTGDSVYNQYQAADLVGVNIGTEANPKNILAFIVGIDPNDPDKKEICFDPSGNEKTCGADPKGYCDSTVNGSACRFADGTFAGKCYNNLCVTNFRGDPLNPGTPLLVEDKPESVSCRAYPEQSSPFPTSVVSAWSPNLNGTDVKSKKPGFAGANVCERHFICQGGADPGKVCTSASDCAAKACVGGANPGKACTSATVTTDCGTGAACEAGTCQEFAEACECNYKKVSYSGGAITKYFSAAWEFENLPHVCIGGPTPGKSCSTNANCNVGGTGGQCVSVQREDVSQGWQGYCLERDTANSINGDPEKSACLTWYPIDQLPGLPDIYNQYVEAGFELGEKFYCLKSGAYKDISTHPGASGGYYCAELSDRSWSTTEWCEPDDWKEYCLKPAIDLANGTYTSGPVGSPGEGVDTEGDPIKCSKKEWIVMGECSEDKCPGPTLTYDDDCPYRCVPMDSYHADPANPFYENPCVPRGAGFDYGGYTTHLVSTWDDARAFDDCLREGVSWSDPLYRSDVSPAPEPYLGCEDTARISTLEENKAWTDRLWVGAATRPPYYSIKTAEEILQYQYNTAPVRFGQVDVPLNEGLVAKSAFCRSDTNPESLKLLSDPLGPNTSDPADCPAGYSAVIDPNKSRPYMTIETERATGDPCTTSADCSGNTGISCGSYLCYPLCERRPTRIRDCPAGYGSCPTTDYGYLQCPVPNRGITSAPDCEAWRPDSSAWAGACSGGAADGYSCSNNETCYDFQCRAGECVSGRGGSGASPSVGGETDFSPGIARLRQIFAKSFGLSTAPSHLKTWDYVAGNYIDGGDTTWNITSKTETTAPGGEGWPGIPKIYALGGCIGDKCKQGTANTVTVNGIDGDGLFASGMEEASNAVGYGGKLKVTMQFFGRADKNTMPIVDVSTNWGDGSAGAVRNRPGKYKNHLGLKEDNSSWCDDTNFGSSSDACTDQYFMFTHTYSCPKGAATSKPACTGLPATFGNEATGCYAASCPEDINGAADGNGSCCVYKPKVQIKDNWGWCNGNCGRGGTGGCYSSDVLDECATALPSASRPNLNPWTSFQGQVIVVPK